MANIAAGCKNFWRGIKHWRASEYLILLSFVSLIVFVSALVLSWWVGLLALVVLIAAPQLAARLHQTMQPVTPEHLPDIAISLQGIFKRLDADDTGVTWEEITAVELEWSENPWGDPQWGAYCDTDWLLRSSKGRVFNVFDSSANRAVLLPALQQHLPGFDFNYSEFDKNYGKRLFDLGGGRVVAWQRSA